MTAKEIELFSRFLEENDLTFKFMYNYNIEEGDTTYSDYLNDVPVERVMDSAFIWFDTPEDYKFWREKDEEWQMYIGTMMED